MHKGTKFFFVCVISVLFTAFYVWYTLSQQTLTFQNVALPSVTDVSDVSSEIESFMPERISESDARSKSKGGIGDLGRAAMSHDEKLPLPVDEGGEKQPRRVLVRHLGLDQSFGFLAMDSSHRDGSGRYATNLTCHRVHFAGGRGICSVVERGFFTTYKAVLFNEAFYATTTLPLNGIPSRTRVSRDGRHAAITVFVSGHSYSEGRFATETSIVDIDTGTVLVANLEEFDVIRDGELFSALDFNFWGVTFMKDSDRFYATLSSNGVFFLVQGNISSRQAYVIRAGVECPSLSPDETRIAFKKRSSTGVQVSWQLSVVDLETFRETELTEIRSVDDQVEWLDNSRVLYGLPDQEGSATSNVWVVSADGTGVPEIFLEDAVSPAVVREGDIPLS